MAGGKQKYPSLSAPSVEYNGLIFAETFGDLAYTMYSHAVSLRDLGCTQSPMNAWITLNGVETLPLRMERHCSNGLAVAEFLEKHQNVDWGFFMPDLNPVHITNWAKNIFRTEQVPLFAFGVKGGYESGLKLLESVENCSVMLPILVILALLFSIRPQLLIVS
ncbi:MAG: hypothetical protein CM1200mP30_33850 [Pseudomonadota bacterium]|nr:MAG: hypothetical protein CM1200mP30_33850 [Pseudomonadota bacterium]